MAEKQSIFGRIAQLARANINALLDSAEDPQKMLDQLVRDYTNNIAEAEQAVAQTIGNLRLAEQDYNADVAAVQEWGQKAVAASAQGQQITARLGNDNLAYVGLACAALGVVWLARGMVLWGLLVSTSIIAAGLYAALDFLLARGLVSTHVADRVKPLGVKIGLACATIAVLHLLVGGRLVIL